MPVTVVTVIVTSFLATTAATIAAVRLLPPTR